MKFKVTVKLLGTEETRALEIVAKDRVVAITAASMQLDADGITNWTLVKVEPVTA